MIVKIYEFNMLNKMRHMTASSNKTMCTWQRYEHTTNNNKIHGCMSIYGYITYTHIKTINKYKINPIKMVMCLCMSNQK